MGNQATVERHPFLVHFEGLFSDLDSSTQLSFKNSFVSLFGGPSSDFGERLYRFFFDKGAEVQDVIAVDKDLFVAAMNQLHTVLFCHSKEEKYHFLISLFFRSKDHLKLNLLALLHTALSCALHVGLAIDISITTTDHLLLSLAAAIMQHIEHHEEESELVVFQRWLTMHSPSLFDGLVQWLCAITVPSSETRPVYHLPVVECGKEKQQLMLVTMWTLSCVLPTVYLGIERKGNDTDDLPCGGTWTCLYSSISDGFSMNRFQHHCFDYKKPSIMMIDCNNEHEHYCFALAMDTDWRDGTYFYGGENFYFIQLLPTYSVLKRGAKLVSLNEKQRGFPKGLRVMASVKYDYCLLEIKPSLDEVRLKEAEWMHIKSIEVWGCGGAQARETQLRMKEWDAREALRRREINSKALQTVWEDNPDRHLMELAGINTSHDQTQTL